MITVISGPAMSGKSTLARMLVNGKTYIETNPSSFEDLNEEDFKHLDAIIIDEVVSASDVDYILNLKEIFGRKMPDLIIVGQELHRTDFDKSLKIFFVDSERTEYKSFTEVAFYGILFLIVIVAFIYQFLNH